MTEALMVICKLCAERIRFGRLTWRTKTVTPAAVNCTSKDFTSKWQAKRIQLRYVMTSFKSQQQGYHSLEQD